MALPGACRGSARAVLAACRWGWPVLQPHSGVTQSAYFNARYPVYFHGGIG